jgi:hypothetical protein
MQFLSLSLAFVRSFCFMIQLSGRLEDAALIYSRFLSWNPESFIMWNSYTRFKIGLEGPPKALEVLRDSVDSIAQKVRNHIYFVAFLCDV